MIRGRHFLFDRTLAVLLGWHLLLWGAVLVPHVWWRPMWGWPIGRRVDWWRIRVLTLIGYVPVAVLGLNIIL